MSSRFGTGAYLEREIGGRGIPPRSLLHARKYALDVPFVKNQAETEEEVQCCLSAAITVCMEYLEQSEDSTKELAMIFHYHYASRGKPDRLLTYRDGIRTAKSRGVCEKVFHPYVSSYESVKKRPSPTALRDGATRLLRKAEKLSRPRDSSLWKALLESGYPLILLFRLYRKAYLGLPESDCIHPPLFGVEPTAGHAVNIIGFDDYKGHFIVQDCRGEEWCDGGRWYLPYSIAEHPRFTHTVGVIKRTSKGGL